MTTAIQARNGHFAFFAFFECIFGRGGQFQKAFFWHCSRNLINSRFLYAGEAMPTIMLYVPILSDLIPRYTML